MTAIYSDERWHKDTDVVWDLTEVTEMHFDWSDFQDWIETDKHLKDVVGCGRDLILVATQLHEAAIRPYTQLARSSPREAIVCRTPFEVEQALVKRKNLPGATNG